MAISGSTILEGAATVAASGGTAVTLTSLGAQNGKNVFIFSTDASALTARTLTLGATLSRPNPSSPGGYTQSRRTGAFAFPKVRADGTRGISTFKWECGFDIELTDAEIEAMCETSGQSIAAALFLPFYKTGNLS